MRCQRCGGHMVQEWFSEFYDRRRGDHIQGWRCINCGHLFDPVILYRQRTMPAAPMALDT
ncbi:MAG: hypothetical protein AB7G48_09595 [Nitrospiraceae bacterium]